MELLGVARRLARASPARPRQADLRRAVSTAYFALFHALARQCADFWIGGKGADRSSRAWAHAYRTLEHGHAKSRCMSSGTRSFPEEIQNFADVFVRLQNQRHRADYDPNARYRRKDVLLMVELAEIAMRRFKAAPRKHRRAFVVWVTSRHKPR